MGALARSGSIPALWMARLGLGAALVVAGLLMAPRAQATTMVFPLTSDHCTGGCGTPPFGEVTLTTNGADVDVTVSLNSPNWFVKTGSADFMAFKFNAIDVVLGDVTVDQTVSGKTLGATTGVLDGDGTGLFSFGIECTDCGNGASDKFNDDIVFHVANATIADLTAPNDLGNVFVADILSDSALGGTGNTGPVDATMGFVVPEPGSSLLLLGLTAWGWTRRSRRGRARS